MQARARIRLAIVVILTVFLCTLRVAKPSAEIVCGSCPTALLIAATPSPDVTTTGHFGSAQDVAAMQKLAAWMRSFGTRTIKGSAATRARIESEFQRLASVNRSREVLIYLSGLVVSTSDQRVLFLPSDAIPNPGQIGSISNAISGSEIEGWLARIPATVWLVIEGRGVGAKLPAGVTVSRRPLLSSTPPNVVTLAAPTAGTTQPPAAFTTILLQALTKGLPKPQLARGKLTYEQLAERMRAHYQRAGSADRPVLSGSGTGHTVMLNPRRALIAQVVSRFRNEGLASPPASTLDGLDNKDLEGLLEPDRPFATPFRNVNTSTVRCDTKSVPTGQIHALLIGIGRFDAPGRNLEGPMNDAELLGGALAARGVSQQQVKVLSGRVTRRDVIQALDNLIERSTCGDTVFIHFSGIGAERVFSGSEYRLYSETVTELGLATSESVLDTGNSDKVGGWLRASELALAVTALRNRGAFTVVSVDGCEAAALDFAGRSREGVWRWSPFGPDPTGLFLQPHAAGFGAFYASAKGTTTFEFPLPPGAKDARIYGVFSFALANALGNAENRSVRQVAEGVAAFYRLPEIISRQSDRVRYTPMFESSEPSHALFNETASADRPAPAAGLPVIELTEPSLTRGLVQLATQDARVAGRVVPGQSVAVVVVNGRPASLTSEGRFTTTVALSPGLNDIQITALTSDGRVGFYKFAVEHAAADATSFRPRRSVALIIGNQAYGEASKQRTLATPMRDAEAVAEVLRDRYGFETELTLPDGSKHLLVLRNASQRQTQAMLTLLRRTLGEDDSLLVYYAGHGWRSKVADQAYWIPVDAEYDSYGTYIDATFVTGEIARMNVKHVLVISDSCYSGAMTRGDDPAGGKPSAPDATRERYLQEMARKRSRMLMSSGADEPVADGLGDGHSVFARALLNGLRSDDIGEVFTAEQLFRRFIRETVIGRSDQSPQYQIIKGSGHEFGDFVFFRTRK